MLMNPIIGQKRIGILDQPIQSDQVMKSSMTDYQDEINQGRWLG